MCRQNGPAREVGDGVTRLGCSCWPGAGGPGRPPGARARGGLCVPAAAPAAAVLARPGPVQSAPRSHPRAPRVRAGRGRGVRVPQPGKPLRRRRAGDPSPPPLGPWSPRASARRPGREPREPRHRGARSGPGRLHSGPRRTGPDSGARAVSGAQVTCPGGPWRASPSPRGQRAYQGPGRALGGGGAGGASRGPSESPQRPSSAPPARGARWRRPLPSLGSSDAAPGATRSLKDDDGTSGVQGRRDGGVGEAPRGPSKAGGGGPPGPPWPGPGHERSVILG